MILMPIRCLRPFVIVALLAFPCRGADPVFKVRRDVAGVGYHNMSGSADQLPILEQNGQGIGLIDYDDDGWIDLFVPNGSTAARWKRNDNPGCRLLKNLGGWRFSDVTEEAGVRGNDWSNGVAIADYDADGDFDIYVLNWGPNRLYRNNGDGTFTDVTSSAGVGDVRWSSSAAFADFDGDGRLDIYVSNYVDFNFGSYPTREENGRPCLYRGIETGCAPWCYDGQRDTLYVNVGKGRFEDRAAAAGLHCTASFRGFGVVAADFDGDRDVDVYVGCDVMPNLYLENSGRGRFVSKGVEKGGAYNHAGEHESGMGVAAADFDRSGSLDLVTTNFADQKNTFYRNRGGVFYDDSETIGLAQRRATMGWGVIAQDFNLDGLTDVFIANGHIYPQVSQLDDPADQYAQAPLLYFQNETGRLVEVETKRAFNEKVAWSLRGCAGGDLDNDRDVDIVAVAHNGNLVFLENEVDGEAMALELVDRRGGRSPIGARVRVESLAMQWLLPNQGYQSSQDHRLYFPLPQKHSRNVTVSVEWPDGGLQLYQVKPKPGRVVRLAQASRDGD